MSGEIGNLALAMAIFVGAHFLLSSPVVRSVVADKLGSGGFMGLYSLVAGASLAWAIVAYGAAPYEEIWSIAPSHMMVPHIAMPFAVLLLFCSVTSRLPTAVGGDKAADDPAPVQGISTVTRHPMLVGTTLWGASHLVANGDLASIILMGGIVVLSIGGMLHIDYRRAQIMGAAWGPIALSTSVIPFVAVIQGRVKIDWSGIGLWRLAGGLAVYAGLVYGHAWFAGVPVIPN